VAVSPNGKFVAAASLDGTVAITSRDGQTFRLATGSRGGQPAFLSDDRFVVSVGFEAIELWDIPDRAKVGELKGVFPPKGMFVSASGRVVVVPPSITLPQFLKVSARAQDTIDASDQLFPGQLTESHLTSLGLNAPSARNVLPF